MARLLAGRSLLSIVCAASLVWPSRPLTAQTFAGSPMPDTGTTTPSPLFSGKDAVLAAVFVAGTIAMFPLDERLAKHLQDSSVQANRFFNHAASGLEFFTSPGAYYIGGGMYIVGRLGHWDRVADLGLHGTEAVLTGDAVTLVLKGIAGRARPFVVADTNPHEFKIFKGITHSAYQSFPSGHATTAFSAAAAVTAETGRWWPGSTVIVGPLMYGGATLVGLSRMYHNKHWASDIAFGAAIGTFAGQKVVQYNHAHPGNFLDRIFLREEPGPAGRSQIQVGWSKDLK